MHWKLGSSYMVKKAPGGILSRQSGRSKRWASLQWGSDEEDGVLLTSHGIRCLSMSTFDLKFFIVSLFNFRFWFGWSWTIATPETTCDTAVLVFMSYYGIVSNDVGDFSRCLVCTYPMQVKEQVEISAVYNLLDVAQCCYQLAGEFQCFWWFQSDWHVYLHLLGVEDVRTLTHVCQMGWSRQFFLLHVFSKSLNLMKLHSWVQLPMAFQSKGLRFSKSKSKSYIC